MTELTIKKLDLDTLTNRKCATKLSKIYNAEGRIDRTRWDVVDSIAAIVTDELFVDDFGTQKNLAKAIGLSASTISKMVRASSVHELDAFRDLKMSTVFEILPIVDDSDKLTGFLTYIGAGEQCDGLDALHGMTQAEVRKALKMYLTDNCPEEVEPETVEPETVEPETVEPNVVVDTNTKIMVIDGVPFRLDDEAIIRLMDLAATLERM